MVKHTHEDIDQFFSKFSQYLRHNETHTLPDLLGAVEKCYSDVPEASTLDHMFDVESWLSPHLLKLHNHSYSHIFRFVVGESGEVLMYYKQWSESAWEPSDAGIKIFKSPPSGSPFLCPSLDRLDYSKLCTHARLYRDKTGITEKEQGWWIAYLEDFKQRCTDYLSYETLSWLLHKLYNTCVVADPSPSLDCEVPDYLSTLQRKERGSHPKVYSGTRPKESSVSSQKQLQASNRKSAKKKASSTSSEQEKTSTSGSKQGKSVKKRAPSMDTANSQQSMAPKEGDLVALCCQQYNERPQIAKVLSISGSKVKVRWYDGSWTRKWIVYTYMKGRWDEEVSYEEIIFYHVKLTETRLLTAKCKRELEQFYNNL